MSDQPPTFETFIASERARINGERESLIAQKAELDQQLAVLDRELVAIAAYENAKAGRVPTATTRTASSAGGGTRRAGQREAVLSVIRAHPDGISPSQILIQMNATSEAEKTSVRNALGALKRNNSVGAKGGNYYPA